MGFEAIAVTLWVAFVLSVVIEAAVKTFERFWLFGAAVANNYQYKKASAAGNLQPGQAYEVLRPHFLKLALAVVCITVTLQFHFTILDPAIQLVMPEFQSGFLGYLLTGLVIGRGSNVTHSIIEKIKVFSQSSTTANRG